MTTLINDFYFIGSPVWGCAEYKGSIFPGKAPKATWLGHYSRVFNTVEGNSTFYGIPTLATFERWAAESEDGFRFALKFPRTVSHDKKLLNTAVDMQPFVKGLEILANANRLGPTFLQLGPDFGPNRIESLATFLRNLPGEMDFAVEVRNHSWFEPDAESQLIDLLERRRVDYVVFDSRALYSQPPSDEFEKASQSRKPKTPVRKYAISRYPILRLIGRNRIEETQKWIDEWVPTISGWIADGRRPFVFTHTPNDAIATEMAKQFHNTLAECVNGLQPIESWPHSAERQMKLF